MCIFRSSMESCVPTQTRIMKENVLLIHLLPIHEMVIWILTNSRHKQYQFFFSETSFRKQCKQWKYFFIHVYICQWLLKWETQMLIALPWKCTISWESHEQVIWSFVFCILTVCMKWGKPNVCIVMSKHLDRSKVGEEWAS